MYGDWPNRKDQSLGNQSNNRVEDKKGFGFLTPDQAGDDIFVHHTAIQGSGFKSLTEGQKVEYTAERTDKGMRATTVVPVK
jgi:CspA family cold shock protein